MAFYPNVISCNKRQLKQLLNYCKATGITIDYIPNVGQYYCRLYPRAG